MTHEAQQRYVNLVLDLRRGRRAPYATILGTLAAAGREPEDVIWEVLSSDRARVPSPGDLCAQGDCPGVLRVESSVRRGEFQVQYVGCPRCGRKAGKRVAPRGTLRRRKIIPKR
jgi:hypothetical protein